MAASSFGDLNEKATFILLELDTGLFVASFDFEDILLVFFELVLLAVVLFLGLDETLFL